MLIPDKEQRLPLAGVAVILLLCVWLGASSEPPNNNPCAQYSGAAQAESLKECMEADSLQREAIYTEQLADFTALLVLFTIVLAGASVWQGILTRQSINLARDEFLASHRPEIVITSVRLLPADERRVPDDQPRSVKIGLTNRGGSSGRITGSYTELSAYELTDLPHPSEFENPNHLAPERRYRVGASDTFTVSTDQYGGGQIGALEENNRSLYLIGWIVYEDESEWKNTRTYFFCRKCDGEFLPFTIFEPYEVTY